MATNIDRRLEKLEEAVKDMSDRDEVDITEEYYRMMDEVWGCERQPGPRPRVRVSREYLERIEKIYGHYDKTKADPEKAE
jgi:hypothetical protein